jgi:hypothetical protein
MSTYLRRTVAEQSKIYQAIKDRAAEYLVLHTCFRKSAVIADLNLEAFADSIRWDYIRDMLQDIHKDVEIIPMAEAFFKGYIEVDGVKRQNTPALQKRLPERFIASGHGKKAAGYVLAVPDNGHFVLKVMSHKNAVATGTRKAADKFTRNARLAGVPMPERIEVSR